MDDTQLQAPCRFGRSSPVARETSVSCSIVTTVQTNVHVAFPVPFTFPSSRSLALRVTRPYGQAVPRKAKEVYPWLRTTRLLRTHARERSLSSMSGFRETRHLERCRFVGRAETR